MFEEMKIRKFCRDLGMDISNNRRIGLTMKQFSVPAEVAVERLRELKMLYHT